MNNAICLTLDGDSLAEKGNFGHAFFLYFTAMEEAVKAMYYAQVHAGILEYNEKVKRDIRNHMDKMTMFFGFSSSHKMINQKDSGHYPKKHSREELIKSLTGIAGALREFRKFREASLFVDLKNNKWNIIVIIKRTISGLFDFLINTPIFTHRDRD